MNTPDEQAADSVRRLAGALEACSQTLRTYLERTGQKAGWLLLGWEVWLELGKYLRASGIPRLAATAPAGTQLGGLHGGGPTDFEGYPVVVDETEPHTIRALPQLKNVRPRTRPSGLGL